jgi:N utilization substance protein A
VVQESQLSLAIGKQGLNVRLANRLADWNIDVKTEEQFDEMDISLDSKRAVSALFGDTEEEEITRISELPDVPEKIVDILTENGVELIETLITLPEEELKTFEGLSEGDVKTLQGIIAENVDIIEEEEGPLYDDEEDYEEDEAPLEEAAPASEEPETYECPECGHPITTEMTNCPSCGVGFSFEFEDESEDEDEEIAEEEIEEDSDDA